MINEREIQDWLVEEGFFKEKIHDENSNFHFIINYPENNIFDIIQPKGKEDMIIIGCATNASPEHLDIIIKSSMDKKIDLIWNFKYMINQFLLDFQIEHPDNILQMFVISSTIYEDGLTKHDLIFEIKKIFKAKLQCLLYMEKVFKDDISEKSAKYNEDGMFR
ncbi:MAG: DUF2299 family protein [Methanobrevibacter sp.]|jgi:hypothetical protein|nr:DUF2299 family protein [Candidatus Methanovirga basalitermitum]